MPFIFFGTPRFAEIILDELEHAGMNPAAIVTQPPKPKGRHLELQPSETQAWAHARGIPIFTPERIRENPTFIGEISALEAECFIVAAYGKILPRAILEIPPRGTLNVHPSLLPRYRGASPVESQILEDERDIGITIMLMDEALDHGPILAAHEVKRPEPWPVKGTVLTEILAHEGGALLAETLWRYQAGKITPLPQDDARATLTKKIEKHDGIIDLAADPGTNLRKIRAYDGWPGAFTTLQRHGKDIRVRITDARIENGNLVLLRIVPEGKKEMSYQDFLRG